MLLFVKQTTQLVLRDWSGEFPFSCKFHGCNQTIPEANQNASVEWEYQICNYKSSRWQLFTFVPPFIELFVRHFSTKPALQH